MMQRYQVDDEKNEKKSSQDNAQRMYLEAYRYSLDLCENAEIAQKVASRFLESMVVSEQSSPVSDFGKPRAVAFPAVAILC
ncbi:MAG: hypothetical protein ACREOI_21310 [bacterium]